MKDLSGKKLSDKSAMALAIHEAQKGLGFVSPNPPVGCVILDKNKRFLSSGFYPRYGGPHAEKVALDKIKNKKLLDQAQLFVTLEPCAHFGKNPPCVNVLSSYSWKSIHYGREDPNPKTKGKGIQKLKSKGFKLKIFDSFKVQIDRMYEAFSVNMTENRAFFALKIASSLDGVSAFNDGESQWISSQKSRDRVQDLRLGFDAVLIGLNTFLQDNPRLNARLLKKKNKVVLLDPLGVSIPLIKKSRLAQVRPLKNIYLVTSSKLKTEASCIRLDQEMDLQALSYKLYQRGIASVLVEGGLKTFANFLNQKASSRIYQFISPCLLGGVKGRFWAESLYVPNLKHKKKLKNMEILSHAPDILLTGSL